MQGELGGGSHGEWIRLSGLCMCTSSAENGIIPGVSVSYHDLSRVDAKNTVATCNSSLSNTSVHNYIFFWVIWKYRFESSMLFVNPDGRLTFLIVSPRALFQAYKKQSDSFECERNIISA